MVPFVPNAHSGEDRLPEGQKGLGSAGPGEETGAPSCPCTRTRSPFPREEGRPGPDLTLPLSPTGGGPAGEGGV